MTGAVEHFKKYSKEFEHKAIIPPKFTCDDKNIFPELQWESPPEGKKSFVLIIDDRDAVDIQAAYGRNHGIIYNIPQDIRKLSEDTPTLLGFGKFGENSKKKQNYYGPCPPNGEHHYYFKLYSLDIMIDDKLKVSRNNIDALMQSHILGEAVLMGRYKRQK